MEWIILCHLSSYTAFSFESLALNSYWKKETWKPWDSREHIHSIKNLSPVLFCMLTCSILSSGSEEKSAVFYNTLLQPRFYDVRPSYPLLQSFDCRRLVKTRTSISFLDTLISFLNFYNRRQFLRHALHSKWMWKVNGKNVTAAYLCYEMEMRSL